MNNALITCESALNSRTRLGDEGILEWKDGYEKT